MMSDHAFWGFVDEPTFMLALVAWSCAACSCAMSMPCEELYADTCATALDASGTAEAVGADAACASDCLTSLAVYAGTCNIASAVAAEGVARCVAACTGSCTR